jgi:hypothetical protein
MVMVEKTFNRLYPGEYGVANGLEVHCIVWRYLGAKDRAIKISALEGRLHSMWWLVRIHNRSLQKGPLLEWLLTLEPGCCLIRNTRKTRGEDTAKLNNSSAAEEAWRKW